MDYRLNVLIIIVTLIIAILIFKIRELYDCKKFNIDQLKDLLKFEEKKLSNAQDLLQNLKNNLQVYNDNKVLCTNTLTAMVRYSSSVADPIETPRLLKSYNNQYMF